MAKFIEFNIASDNGKRPLLKYGYYIIPIYGIHGVEYEKSNWIEDNLHGHWTSYVFGRGQSYCFSNELDAMAFKLMWT